MNFIFEFKNDISQISTSKTKIILFSKVFDDIFLLNIQYKLMISQNNYNIYLKTSYELKFDLLKFQKNFNKILIFDDNYNNNYNLNQTNYNSQIIFKKHVKSIPDFKPQLVGFVESEKKTFLEKKFKLLNDFPESFILSYY